MGNEPFEGQVVGAGEGIQVDLLELAQALRVGVEERDGLGWTLAGRPVPTEERGGTIWIELSDLPRDVVRVLYSEPLNIVDLYRNKNIKEERKGIWGLEGTLVYFYLPWSPACIAMEPTIQNLEGSRLIEVVRLNIHEPASDAYQNYVHFFEGNKIPYFVLLGPNGLLRDKFNEFQTYPKLIERVKKNFDEES